MLDNKLFTMDYEGYALPCEDVDGYAENNEVDEAQVETMQSIPSCYYGSMNIYIIIIIIGISLLSLAYLLYCMMKRCENCRTSKKEKKFTRLRNKDLIRKKQNDLYDSKYDHSNNLMSSESLNAKTHSSDWVEDEESEYEDCISQVLLK
ncbi:hypothetical protein THOM_0532 [Trachipleistophora hominis]|uniref:Uncharacterized protein n=1 Tax=Trachipleistophora hominis TaxID=72359 RepID=L7JYJ5_TRAHO|nr:hypothetical protein THOM_0532 [Trachipleistophora hominis]